MKNLPECFENVSSDDPTPNLEQARRTALMAHSIVIMLKEMGLPDEKDDTLSIVCTDLGDIWGMQEEYVTRLQSMLRGERDWSLLADALIDISSIVEHMAWHATSVRESILELAEYCYSQSESK